MILSPRETIRHTPHTLINWRQRSGTNIEFRMKIIIDFDRISRIFISGEKDCFGLGDDGLSGREVEEFLSEGSGGGVVASFGEGRHGESQSEGEMSGLESTVREVGGEFELSFERIGRVGDSTSFHFERKSDEVFSTDYD